MHKVGALFCMVFILLAGIFILPPDNSHAQNWQTQGYGHHGDSHGPRGPHGGCGR